MSMVAQTLITRSAYLVIVFVTPFGAIKADGWFQIFQVIQAINEGFIPQTQL